MRAMITQIFKSNCSLPPLIFIQHEKKVLDELQIEHLQKKQLLNKATELLACLDKGMEYDWSRDQVRLLVALVNFMFVNKHKYLLL